MGYASYEDYRRFHDDVPPDPPCAVRCATCQKTLGVRWDHEYVVSTLYCAACLPEDVRPFVLGHG